MRRLLAATAVAALTLASCSGGGKKAASPTPTSPLLQQTTTTAPATPVVARIVSPEKGSVQGTGGVGMVVVLTFTAKDPSVLPADFRLGGALPSPAASVKPGHNAAFPGLVVGLSTTGPALGGPSSNLANLFQIVSPAHQPDGSLVVTAVWTNATAGFGVDTDVTLGAFTVSGTAPDVVPASPGDMVATSNPVQVTFHLAGAANATASSTSSSTPSGSSTTAKPSASSSTTAKPATSSTTVAGASTTTTAKATTTTVPATTTTTKFLGLF